MDGHMLRGADVGSGPGYGQSLVGFLAEVCQPGALEHVEGRLRGTVMTVSPLQVPGRPPEGPRDIPTDPVAVRATVERANEWLRCVRSGQVAGEDIRDVPNEEVGGMIRSGALVAGGLILLSPPGAIEGLQQALRPRPLQSDKVKDLNFALQMAMRDAQALAPLFR